MKKLIAQKISLFFKVWYRLIYGSHVKFGKRTIVNHKLCFKGPGRLIFGDDVNLWSHKEPNEFFTFDPSAVIKIGARSRLNGVGIQCKTAVTIGEDCLIGSALIVDTDFHSVHFEHRNDPAFIKTKPVQIGDRVWLAGQCAILKGVTIGQEAVVGFRAVVTKDVAAKTVVAGNPAKEIGSVTHEQSEVKPCPARPLINNL